MKKAVQQWLCIRCLHPSFSRPPDDMLCRSCRKVANANNPSSSAQLQRVKSVQERQRGSRTRRNHTDSDAHIRKEKVDGHTQAQAEATQVRTLRGVGQDQRPVGRQPQRKNARRSS